MRALRFVARRLLHTGVVLFGVSVLSFLLLELAPGDFFEELRMRPQVSPETIARLRNAYGMDRPLPVRYLRWIQSALHGDLGFSLAYDIPATPLLLARAGNTLLLTGIALVLTWLLALPLGIATAAARGSPGDRLCSLLTSLLLAIPEVPPGSASLLPGGDPVRFGRSDIITFTPHGTSSSGTLYVSDGHSTVTAVVVYGGTGRLRLWRFDRDRWQWTR